MTKTKLLILEDDILQSAALADMLSDFGYEVVGTAVSGEQALQIFKEKMPDIVLLDIVVEGNMDGIEVGKVMRQIRPTPLIYLTAYAEKFEGAKTTYPAAFFTKPYNERDLLNAIDLAVWIFIEQYKNGDEKPAEIPSFSNIYFSTDCLWLKTKNSGPFERLPVSEILFIKSANIYVDIYAQTKPSPYTLTLGISEFAGYSSYPELAQTHRCYIANVDHVTRFTPTKATVAGIHEIPVSKTYLDSFRAALLGREKR